MTVLGKFSKQPNEVLDYDVDFTDWFATRPDTPVSSTTTVDTGITLIGQVRTGMVVKVALGAGTSGVKYKATVRMTTSAGFVKEVEFYCVVKET